MRRLCLVLPVLGVLLSACDPLPPTGKLAVTIAGLPTDAHASVRVIGLGLPSGAFTETVSATKTLELNPGAYSIRIDTVLAAGATALYSGPIFTDTITIARGKTIPLDATYHLSSGSITVNANGLPPLSTAAVLITTPTGQARPLNAPGTLSALTPGVYTLTADTTQTIAGDYYAADVRTQQITVPVSLTPVAATLNYTIASATVTLNVTGLGQVTDPPITVTGPQNYSRTALGATALHGLKAGTYTVSAANVNGTCPSIFTASNAPTPLVQSRSVGPTANEIFDIPYTQKDAPPAWLDLKLENAYPIQVSQNWAGTVPLLSGKPALLRVFVTANQCNTAQPKVRLTLNSGATYDLTGTESTVRQAVAEQILVSTWNFTIPAAEVKPGLAYSVKLDPDNAFAESNETNNSFPATGTKAVDVHTAATVAVRFVPIAQSQTAGGLTAVVTVDSAERFLDWPRRIHPVGTYSYDIHDTYTSSKPVLQNNDANGAWSGILSEVNALRASEGSPRYYYGVVRVGYNSGVAGLGYISTGNTSRAAIGWSFLGTSGSGSYVMAHEMGHNYGRLHTPCGGPGGIDPAYPSTGFYQGGFIGAVGYDFSDGTLKQADIYTDIMGYCGNRWISDYTYMAMMARVDTVTTLPSIETAASVQPPEPGLLVWGRVVNGVPILEPAFEVDAPVSLPRSGPYTIAAYEATGAQLFSYGFSGERIADLPYDGETFAFVIPKTALGGRTLSQLRLSARGRVATNVASVAIDGDPELQTERAGAGRLRVRWNAGRFPALMVRNPVSHQVIAIARGGDATIASTRDDIEVDASNRVGSARRVIRAR